MSAPDTRTVLLISYLFPPSGGVGVQRALAYARYLPACGCRLHVLTASNAAPPVRDEALVKMIPPGTPVHGAFTPEVPYGWRDWIWKRLAKPAPGSVGVETQARGSEGVSKATTALVADTRQASGGIAQSGLAGSETAYPAEVARSAPLGGWKQRAVSAVKRLFSPDPQVVWRPFALRKAAELVRRHGIDTILVTVPPFSALRIGVDLKRQFPHLTLISDFRDQWVGYYLAQLDNSADDAFRRQLALSEERLAVEVSDYVVTVTPEWTRALITRYPELPPAKFLTVPNGYDPEMFRHFQPRPHGAGRMVVTYMGSVYTNPVYSPQAWLDAVDSLPEEVRGQVETRFIGRVAREAEPMLKNRRSAVRLYGFLPQHQGFALLEETDYLLLLIGEKTVHSGKLFEYLATGKPVLAVTPPDGEVARVIAETGGGRVASAEDPEALRAMILEAWTHWRAGNVNAGFAPDAAAIEAYARPNTVALLARLTGITRGAA